MNTRIKRLMVAALAVVTITGAVSVSLTGSASAHSEEPGHKGQWHDNWGWHNKVPNNMWQILQYVQSHWNEIKQGGPLLHEHASLAVPYLKAQLNSEADLTALTAAVNLNTQQLGETMDKLYPGTKAEFIDLWQQHLKLYTDYMNAAKAHDTAAMALNKQYLHDFVYNVVDMLDGVSHKIDYDKLANQLLKHVDGTTDTIDAMVAGDWGKVWTNAHMGFEDMTEVTITLVSGAKLR